MPAEGFEHARPLIEAAAAAGARLIVTPEGSNLLQRDRPAFFRSAPHEDHPDALGPWAGLASSLGVTLVAGSLLLQTGGGRAANRTIVFGPDGSIISTYDKIHLFDVNLDGASGLGQETRESAVYHPGSHAPVVELEGARTGLTICYDLRFPELYRKLARSGADIILAPAAFTAFTGAAHWDVLTRARAIETGAFVLAPAQGGTHEDGRQTWGRSRVISPWGTMVAELEHDQPGWLVADIDPAEVVEARRKIPAWSLNRNYSVGSP
jgi:deaminated glutathione amidase